MSRSLKSLLLLAAFATLPAPVVAESSVAQSAPPPGGGVVLPPDPVQLERRLESVKTLLESSSAAKQIAASNDKTAIDGRARALSLWQQAKEAYDRKDYAAAQRLLVEAPKVMFAAARLAAPEQILSEKVKADYGNRRESVRALLVAQKRISDEKGSVTGAAEAARDIEKMLVDADKLAESGQYEQARAQVDKAYLVAKASVGQMRSGDTLVRSLTFASKEEEYRYELDRNDSLAMLYKVLVEQKGAPNPTGEALVKKGAALRIDAEKSASRGDHSAAVKLLEDSTSEYVRAIRSAGVFIPG